MPLLLIQTKQLCAERKVHSSCRLETGQSIGSDVCRTASFSLPGESLCLVVMPHAPRRAPQTRASGWKLLPSFELELTSVGMHRSPWAHGEIGFVRARGFGVVWGCHKLDLPALKHGRIRTTPPSCHRLPGDLPAFPIFLCYKFVLFQKISSADCQKPFCFPKNSSDVCL